MLITFPVGEDAIARGIRCSAFSCPVALAARETFLTDRTSVTCHEIYIGPNEVGILPGYYPMPSDLFRFVADFDRGRAVSPGTFTLDVVAAPAGRTP